MQIKIEGTEYSLPASLAEITLQRRIEYDRAYGQYFRGELEKIKAMPEASEQDSFARGLALSEYYCQLAFRTVAFYGAIPDDVLQQVKLEDILLLYDVSMRVLSEEIDYNDPSTPIVLEHSFNEELWQIAPPELTHESKMTFGEFLDAKQTTKDLIEFGNEHWEALLRLCCVYFRKKGERYHKSMITEGGERYRLLQQLPLDIALHVGFFFLHSMNIYLTTFPYSTSQEGPQDPN